VGGVISARAARRACFERFCLAALHSPRWPVYCVEGFVSPGGGRSVGADLKEWFDMNVGKSLSVIAALVALGVAGPAIASASDEGNNDNGTAVTATSPGSDEGQSTADEQQSGEQGDVENTDLATEVEQADGADNEDGANDEGQVGDGDDGQVDDGPDGD